MGGHECGGDFLVSECLNACLLAAKVALLLLIAPTTHHESQQTIRPEKEIKTKKIKTEYTHIQIRKSNFYKINQENFFLQTFQFY